MVADFKAAGSQANGQLLSAARASDFNNADYPDRVSPVNLVVERDATAANHWRVTMPPMSVATVIVS